tara:strand:- start:334 stop:1254 length:921 start_codon:yes stop_codon:yes gene_type:complete
VNQFIKKNKKLSVFLICLIISIMIWLSMSMSRTYQITYDLPIVYKNLAIDKKIAKNPLFLKSTISSSGWDLFTKKIKNRTIEIDLAKFESLEVLNFSNTKSIVKEEFSDLNILEVFPLFFTLKFEKLFSKKVPIKLNVKQNFADNFYLNTPTILIPDSVQITSDSASLKNILFLETQLVTIIETDSSIEKIKIIIPGNIKSNISGIKVKFDIEEFAEKEFIIPINIENKPKNADLVFYPEEIRLKCLIPFTEFKKIMASDFYISVDFNNIEVSKNNTLSLSIGEHPKSVKNIQLEKDEIEFIIYSN